MIDRTLFYLQKIELAVIEVHTKSKNQDSCFFLLFFHINKEQYECNTTNNKNPKFLESLGKGHCCEKPLMHASK
jgi:hypothetical protein